MFLKTSLHVAAVALALVSGPALAQAPKTIRFIAQADLRILDPIWTTAYLTRNHGYMVFDTLFATDANSKIQPQMVESWTVSPDQLTYSFTLRPGLKFHDGAPVLPADCIASLQRWMKRDALGSTIADVVAEMTPIDARSFSIKLKTPFPLLLNGLGKLSSNVPFIMPERLAKTDASVQIKEMIGSGPFKWVAEEWQPGNKAVYVKNTDYVPRSEPPSWAAGGKVVKVDRVEWLYIPDASTAMAALQKGEVDWWQEPAYDILPILKKDPNIGVINIDPLGSTAVMRFNHINPPFNDLKLRQALLASIDQREYLTAIAGDPSNWKVCPSVFACGTPMANEAGSELLKRGGDMELAKKLVKESNYKGEKIALMGATDLPFAWQPMLLAADTLKKLGLNVELQANDWGTVVTRRSSREPVEKNGWSLFSTGIAGADIADPALHYVIRGNGDASWAGWMTDQPLEDLRNQWMQASDDATRKKLAEAIQLRALDVVPYVPLGTYEKPTAFRKNLSGFVISPAIFMWNVEKKG